MIICINEKGAVQTGNKAGNRTDGRSSDETCQHNTYSAKINNTAPALTLQ